MLVTPCLQAGFSAVAVAQVIVILCALVYLIAQAYALAYLSIIDLLFPALGLFACWRFKTTELKASANTIRSSHLMLVYIAWCVLWIVLGVILLLFRTGVIVAGSSNTLAQQFFGNASASYTTPLIILTAVQLGTMVAGLVAGIILRKAMVDSVEERMSPGFV